MKLKRIAQKIMALPIAALLMMLSLFGCKMQVLDGDGMVGHSYTHISQEEAVRRMALDDGHIILDVRTREEYAEGHIPGAVCLPNEEIIADTPPVSLPDRDQILLVYCRSGRRSKEAAQKLYDMGYTQVYEFGGILDWQGEVVSGEA